MGWYVLAFASTIAGNLTLIGSMASLIVAETAVATTAALASERGSISRGAGRALRDAEEMEMTFSKFTKFGLPSTLLLLALSVPALVGVLLLF